MTTVSVRNLGANVTPEGVWFRVWAPRVKKMALRVLGPQARLVAMSRGDDDVFEAMAPGLGAGADYLFVLDGERERPDPRSRYQPHGVHGASRVVQPDTFVWTDHSYRAPSLAELVLYELHVGTFTPEGTFDAIRPRLRALAELGVTAIELMPVAEFPGARNWGYDGVSLFAPHSAYGGPDALRGLVDACHASGIAVILDVVYNHLGPEGNYLGELGPYFTDRYRTPWGSAINYDDRGSDQVRAFIIDNAVSWLVEHHIDGLRLDAVHGIFDQSAVHLLEELTATFHAAAARLGREVVVIAESDLNDPRVVRPVEGGGLGLDAQWSDDFHHALHTVMTGDRHGYFADFGAVADLGKAIEKGFVYDGKRSPYRGRRHGRPTHGLPSRRLVIFQQNHDQIANGSGGGRAAARGSLDDQKLAALVLLAAPNVPLLFMGQEYGETAPFHYFTSHGDDGLASAVTAGRRDEFRGFGWEESFHDPQDPATFAACKLDWSAAGAGPHAALRSLYRDLLRLRREHPCFGTGGDELFRVETSEAPRWLFLERGDPEGQAALVFVNFEPYPVQIPILSVAGPRWELALWTGEPRYGGAEPAPRPMAIMDMDLGAPATLTVPGRSGVVYLRSDVSRGSDR